MTHEKSKTVVTHDGNVIDVEGFRQSLRNFPSYARKEMDQNGVAFLSDCVHAHNTCGCKIVGNGTLQFPLKIEYCATHNTLSAKEGGIILGVFVPDANIKSLLENLPEYSSPSLTCIGFDYAKCEYRFVEEDENDKEHILTLEKARIGLVKMFNDIYSGKLNRSDIPIPATDDALGNWDADILDILIQYSLLGECIYG